MSTTRGGGGGRYGKLSQQIETMLSQGRRNSAAAIITRLRSGSLTGWTAGGPMFSKSATFSPDCYDDENPTSDSETAIAMQAKHDRDPKVWRERGNVNLGSVLSALYCKILVTAGIAFPMSEVVSTYIPPSFYDGFYLYLYIVSIIFMMCMFVKVIKLRATKGISRGVNSIKSRLGKNDKNIPDVIKEEDEEQCSHDGTDKIEESDTLSPLGGLEEKINDCSRNCRDHKHQNDNKNSIEENLSSASPTKGERSESGLSQYKSEYSGQRSHFGSFYLRMGAVAFGIGSLIYSGLEFGQYFELESDTKCRSYKAAVTPAVKMVFTFTQMYFIFLNSQMAVRQTTLRKQFGLMHLIGTNLCVWLSVLVEETKHEILHFYDPENNTIRLSYGMHYDHSHYPSKHVEESDITADDITLDTDKNITSEIIQRFKRGLKGPHSMYECRRTNIMGSLVDNASPFLFPCTIEYSLICAAICYVMWKSLAKRRVKNICLKRSPSAEASVSSRHVRSPHHYTVDCAGSNKGLFIGLFFLIFTIMSLILNFVLIKHPEYKELATLEVNITEIILYSTSTIAVLIGMFQMRQLRYEKGKNLELDNILLIVAQSGSFVFNFFCIIGGHLTVHTDDHLVLVTPMLCLIQLILQTLFILDASKRVVATTTHVRRKPGREIVTFLLVCNLAMWLINALEKSRGDSHPNQLKFYGVWGWTIIADISMPLAIFYRFHSTVCLCEIWKKTYKVRHSD